MEIKKRSGAFGKIAVNIERAYGKELEDLLTDVELLDKHTEVDEYDEGCCWSKSP